MTKQIKLSQIVPDHFYGMRLDQVLAEMFPDYSRSRLKEWILADAVQLDQSIQNLPKFKVVGGEQVDIIADIVEEQRFGAEQIALDILHEDEHILVINKPAGLVRVMLMAHCLMPYYIIVRQLRKFPGLVLFIVWIKTLRV